MKFLKNPWFLALFVMFTISSCSRNPQPIKYGGDACHYCQMTIVDKIYGAELITDKGKVFKFDAAECLIRHKNELENLEGYQLLTNYFESPEQFISVKEGFYLVSKNMPSPMGAYLTAFKTEETAKRLKEELGGTVYNWAELDEHLNK